MKCSVGHSNVLEPKSDLHQNFPSQYHTKSREYVRRNKIDIDSSSG